jgi:Meiotically up-regulated gene 113
MTIIRVKHQKDYTCISNEAIRDKTLSFKARGGYAFLLSLNLCFDDLSTAQLIELLMENGRIGREQAYGIIGELRGRNYLPKIKKVPTSPMNGKPGYVYLAKASDPIYKIGSSKTPFERVKKLTSPQGKKPSVVYVLETSDMGRLEQWFHDYFSEKRVFGEWFSLTNHDEESFKNLASTMMGAV